jgi:hypothetical protein
MQQGSKNIIRGYQEKVANLNKAMSERGMQLFQEQFLDAPFRGEPSARWHFFARRALLLDSPKFLGMTREKYLKAATAKLSELTNEEFAGLSNALENKGPKAIGASTKVSFFSSASVPEYELLMIEAENLITIYNEDLQKSREMIDQAVKDEFQPQHDAIQEEFKASKN